MPDELTNALGWFRNLPWMEQMCYRQEIIGSSWSPISDEYLIEMYRKRDYLYKKCGFDNDTYNSLKTKINQ